MTHRINGQLVVCCHLVSCRNLSLCILYLCTRRERITSEGVQCHACLLADFLGCLYDNGVDCGHVQHIGHRNIVTILSNVCGQGGNLELLAVRGHALGELVGFLGQVIEAAEFNGLAAVFGNWFFHAELIVHQICLCRFQQGGVIIGFHFSGQIAVPCDIGICIKQCQIHAENRSVHSLISS